MKCQFSDSKLKCPFLESKNNFLNWNINFQIQIYIYIYIYIYIIQVIKQRIPIKI
jgi:hypothetical protein